MNTHNIIEELYTITTCHEVVSELLGEIPDHVCSNSKVAILLAYLNSKQLQILESLSQLNS